MSEAEQTNSDRLARMVLDVPWDNFGLGNDCFDWLGLEQPAPLMGTLLDAASTDDIEFDTFLTGPLLDDEEDDSEENQLFGFHLAFEDDEALDNILAADLDHEWRPFGVSTAIALPG